MPGLRNDDAAVNRSFSSFAGRANRVLIAVWGGVAALCLMRLHPSPVPLSAFGAATGLVTGLLQRRSLHSSPDVFAEATSAIQVRRAFKTNRAGRAAIALTWIAAALLFLGALAQSGNVPLAFVAGYVSFMFMRELISSLPFEGAPATPSA
jgi:hypothetical protein